MKVGKREAGVHAARSHTGAISGRYEIYKAAFKKAGIIEVDGYEGLKDACKVLNTYDLVAGKRVLIVTDGGGVGVSIVDACEEYNKPIIICSPGGEFTRRMTKLFKEKGMPVFFTPESAARVAAVLAGGKR